MEWSHPLSTTYHKVWGRPLHNILYQGGGRVGRGVARRASIYNLRFINIIYCVLYKVKLKTYNFTCISCMRKSMLHQWHINEEKIYFSYDNSLQYIKLKVCLLWARRALIDMYINRKVNGGNHDAEIVFMSSLQSKERLLKIVKRTNPPSPVLLHVCLTQPIDN